jgi:hypothetical protein
MYNHKFVIMNELEDIFNTKEFKSLKWSQRLWIRIKIAIIGTLTI